MNTATDCPVVMTRFAHGRKDTMNIRAEEFPRPPDKEKPPPRLAPGNGGEVSKHHTNNANQQTPKKQATPCIKCRHFYGPNPFAHCANEDERKALREFLGGVVSARANRRNAGGGRRWSECQLSATRDPGVQCRYFLDSRGGADG
jgi:hypothetical protein